MADRDAYCLLGFYEATPFSTTDEYGEYLLPVGENENENSTVGIQSR